MIKKAKELMFSKWQEQLEFLRSKPKCADYGIGATADSLWALLPQESKQHWLERVS